MAIRDIPDAFGYIIFAIMDDGEPLCVNCVRDETNPIHGDEPDDGWRLVGWDHTGNMEPYESVICAHCGKLIAATTE